MSTGIHVEGTEYEEGEEGAYMWKAAQQRMSEHEWVRRDSHRGETGTGH